MVDVIVENSLIEKHESDNFIYELHTVLEVSMILFRQVPYISINFLSCCSMLSSDLSNSSAFDNRQLVIASMTSQVKNE